ncbi:MAG: glycosyltransferase, partial [Patescibacteria group bacterium]
CYCHTPTRYLWSDTHSYVQELGVNRLVKKLLPFFLSNIRIWDKMAADRVDEYIANSKLVQTRIQKYYKKSSTIIYPPVNTAQFNIGQPQDYYLAGGRMVAYKRFDLIVAAFNRIGRPIKIFGDGPELNSLKRLAKSNIEFVGRVSGEQLNKLYGGALAFINPQVEDFGITMIEAMACGRPVLAYQRGGATEIVQPGITGEFFAEQTWEDLADAIMHFKPEQYNAQTIGARAEEFSLTKFKASIQAYVTTSYQEYKKNILIN